MVDKTIGMITIGQTRLQHLSDANECYVRGCANPNDHKLFMMAEAFLRAFESTLAAGTESKRRILQKNEQIEKDKAEMVRKWEVKKDNLGYWEQKDAEYERDQIEATSLQKKINSFYEIGSDTGLFND